MKVSDTKFLSWGQDPAWDDFPHNFRFFAEDTVFTFNFNTHEAGGLAPLGVKWEERPAGKRG